MTTLPLCPLAALELAITEASLLGRTGRQALAELEVHTASLEGSLPSLRLLEAAWQAERGDLQGALATLEPVAQQHSESSTHWAVYQDLLTLTASADLAALPSEAESQTQNDLPEASASATMALADALVEQPDLIASLTHGLLLDAESESRRDLRDALITAAPRLLGQGWDTELCLSLARLAYADHDLADTQKWASRGLEHCPGQGDLAILLDCATNPAEVSTTDQTTEHQPVHLTAIQALEAAHEQHPDYPDVATALVRRTMREGMIDVSMRHFNAVQQSAIADHPVVRRLTKELQGTFASAPPPPELQAA